jgi:phosphohistidine phosphatase SixA
MPPTLILIRHGQATHNVTKDYTIPDPPLTDEGIQQCRELASHLRSKERELMERVKLVITSPMIRCCQTTMESLGWLAESEWAKQIEWRADAMWQGECLICVRNRQYRQQAVMVMMLMLMALIRKKYVLDCLLFLSVKRTATLASSPFNIEIFLVTAMT